MKYSIFLLSFINLLNILWLNIGIVEGIIGGKLASKGQFNYHVSVLINNKYACGGAIIEKQYVITAAQCIIGENGNFIDGKLSILTPSAGLDGLSKMLGTYSIKVIKAYVPYEFRSTGNIHLTSDPDYLETGDIAVLKLHHSIPYDRHTSFPRLQLPIKRQNGKYERYSLQTSNFTGYGQETPSQFIKASYQENLGARHNRMNKLKYIELAGLSRKQCQKIYPNIQDSLFCTGLLKGHSTAITGSCLGDIGGPLVANGVTLIGILVRYPKNCDATLEPTIFTRITYSISFLQYAMSDIQKSNMRVADYARSNKVLEIIPKERHFDLVNTLDNINLDYLDLDGIDLDNINIDDLTFDF